MNLLRRELAPVGDTAWKQIEDQARHTLSTLFSVRRFADVLGPHGIDYAAAPVGRLSMADNKPAPSVGYGVHQVQPLIEVRASFQLSVWELDNAERGAGDIDLSSVERAAYELAKFEEETVYAGRPDASVSALKEAGEHSDVALGGDRESVLPAVAKGVSQLRSAGVGGPYAFIAPPSIWSYLAGTVDGRPFTQHVERVLDGPVLFSSFADTPLLVSLRGGDFELVLGQDAAVGYLSHDANNVELYLTESFTFRVLDGNAVLRFA